MSTVASDNEIEVLQKEVIEAKKRLDEARKRKAPEPIKAYELQMESGKVSLSELFGDKDDLIVIHNMGSGCIYCTMWADGLNGLLPHLENRAAVVLVSPQSPKVQKEFAAKRGWKFRMISAEGSSFIKDMGFYSDGGEWVGALPGVSVFHKSEDGAICRTGKAEFGPGDDFCAAWPLFDLLQGGPGDWEPKYSY